MRNAILFTIAAVTGAVLMSGTVTILWIAFGREGWPG